MTTQPVAIDVEEPAECWCCGQRLARNAMISLGNHPEATVCLRCAHFLHRQAQAREDAERPSPTARARDWLRSGRQQVMRRQWQHKPIIGPILRWLGPRMP